MRERRKHFRGRVIYGGVVEFNRLNSTIDCVIRNFTQDGARIEFPAATCLPDEFGLSIVAKGETFSSRVVWRIATAAGVAFNRDIVIPFRSLRATSISNDTASGL